MDRLKALEIFRQVAQCSSFSRAADTLNIRAPIVTRVVKELENQLGLRLLHRSTRSVVLTPEGQEVLDLARSVLDSFEELSTVASLHSSEIAGEIRISVPMLFGMRFLGPALASFMHEHPRVKVDLQLVDSSSGLIESGVDLALRIGRKLPDSVIARPVGEVALGIFAAPAYLDAKGVPRHPADLAQHACLTCGDALAGVEWILANKDTGEQVEHRPRGSLNSNTSSALLDMALHGMGLVLLPAYLAAEPLARGALRPVLGAWAAPSLSLLLTYASREHQPRRVRMLIDHLAQSLLRIEGVFPIKGRVHPVASIQRPAPIPHEPRFAPGLPPWRVTGLKVHQGELAA